MHLFVQTLVLFMEMAFSFGQNIAAEMLDPR